MGVIAGLLVNNKNRTLEISHKHGSTAPIAFGFFMQARAGQSCPISVDWGDVANTRTTHTITGATGNPLVSFTYTHTLDLDTTREKKISIYFQNPAAISSLDFNRDQRITRIQGFVLTLAEFATFDIARNGGLLVNLPVFKTGLQNLYVSQNALTAPQVFNALQNSKATIKDLRVGSGDEGLRSNGQVVTGRQLYDMAEYVNLEVFYANFSMADFANLHLTKLKDFRFWASQQTAVPALPNTIEQIHAGITGGALGNPMTTAFNPAPYLSKLYVSKFNNCFGSSGAGLTAGLATVDFYHANMNSFLTAQPKVLELAGNGMRIGPAVNVAHYNKVQEMRGAGWTVTTNENP